MSGLAKVFGNRMLGVLFIALIAFGLWMVNGIFTQKFISFDRVALHTDTVGLNLPVRADVKIRGVIVGEVLKAEPGENGAVLTLGIKPDKISEIPANVTASILPKTLFGEKYVALDIPTQPAAAALRTGDQITQTAMPVEVERVLNDIYPLLRTIQPAELSYTLNALADALEGRGEQLGQSIVTLDG
jgi:phospholipid/cholesterol/gamma-HCH transport system substrate-binding protein